MISTSQSPISLGSKTVISCRLSPQAPNMSSNGYGGVSVVRYRKSNVEGGFRVFASVEANNRPSLAVVFDPFEEVKKKELLLVPATSGSSLARQKYSEECEAAINDQINVEYNISYVDHAMCAYFDRDNVALKGFAKSQVEKKGSMLKY